MSSHTKLSSSGMAYAIIATSSKKGACHVCEQKTLRKVYLSPPAVFVRGESTIGQLADKNYRKMGHYEKQEKMQQDKAPSKMTKEQKEKRATHQKINSMTPEQKIKWIKNGD